MFILYFQEVLVGLVAATVFKTVVRNDKSSAGGFDSHALPFMLGLQGCVRGCFYAKKSLRCD